MPVLLEKREAGGGASGRLLEQLRGDWAEMRVLQWFRGVRPHQVREVKNNYFLVSFSALSPVS